MFQGLVWRCRITYLVQCYPNNCSTASPRKDITWRSCAGTVWKQSRYNAKSAGARAELTTPPLFIKYMAFPSCNTSPQVNNFVSHKRGRRGHSCKWHGKAGMGPQPKRRGCYMVYTEDNRYIHIITTTCAQRAKASQKHSKTHMGPKAGEEKANERAAAHGKTCKWRDSPFL